MLKDSPRKMTVPGKIESIPTSESAMSEFLSLSLHPQVAAANAGLFVSRGVGRHPTRVIESHELIFVEDGRLGMFEGDREFVLGGGETLLLFPGRRHGGTLDYPDDLRFYWIHFSVPAPRRGSERLRVPQCARLSEPERMLWLFRRYLDDQAQGRLTPPAASAWMQLMLAEVQSAGRVGGACGDDALAQQVEEILRTRFDEPLSTATVAAELRYSPDHIARVYKSVYGATILNALHRHRILYAKRLLLEPGQNIGEIARICGYHDPAQFRKLFKRNEGVCPSTFRRLFARTYINTE